MLHVVFSIDFKIGSSCLNDLITPDHPTREFVVPRVLKGAEPLTIRPQFSGTISQSGSGKQTRLQCLNHRNLEVRAPYQDI